MRRLHRGRRARVPGQRARDGRPHHPRQEEDRGRADPLAALHAQAPTYADTDWPQILELYDALLRRWPSPVVALNRAVALAEIEGPERALEVVDSLPGLGNYRYLHITRAELLTRLGRRAEAAEAYRAALQRTGNAVERQFVSSLAES